MNFKWSSASVPKAVVLVLAVVVGALLESIVRPSAASAKLQLLVGFGLTYPVATLISIVFVLLALGILENSVARQKQLDQSLLEAFLEYIPDNVYFKDLDSRFLRISHSMAKFCGLKSPEQALNKTDADIFSEEHAKQALLDEQEIIRTGRGVIEKEEKETWPDGHETWALTTKLPLRDRGGCIVGTMGISHNVTDRKLAELQMRHMALHDALTGLPNRVLLEDRLAQAIAVAKRSGDKVAVLLLDLDRFKNVNDSLGHHTGDRVLENIATRLKQCARASDTIARSGGDEFVLVCSGLSSHEEIEQIASRVLRVVAEPVLIERHQLQLAGTIGIAQFPDDDQNPDKLLQFAETAMFEAKKRGRARFTVFTPGLTEVTRRQQEFETDLSNALSRDEFVVHYQPIVESQTGGITGMEALLRWRHPKLGLISPDRFIPQLEEMGLMVEVGRWVLRSACRQAREWNQLGITPIRIAVNVSTQQFYEGKILDAVESALNETRLDPSHLELELTESRTLDSSEATVATMRRLKQIGVSLSLDDFGTGWSSLSYLRLFPFDRIKIDRSFVRDLANDRTAEAMVKSILALAQILGFSAIAEGVENAKQRDLLTALRCREMQGFYFSRPMVPADGTALLRSAETTNSNNTRFGNRKVSRTMLPGTLLHLADQRRSEN